MRGRSGIICIRSRGTLCFEGRLIPLGKASAAVDVFFSLSGTAQQSMWTSVRCASTLHYIVQLSICADAPLAGQKGR